MERKKLSKKRLRELSNWVGQHEERKKELERIGEPDTGEKIERASRLTADLFAVEKMAEKVAGNQWEKLLRIMCGQKFAYSDIAASERTVSRWRLAVLILADEYRK